MIFSYKTEFPSYGLGWCNRSDRPFCLAVGSFIEEYNNKVQIIQLSNEKEFVKLGEVDHPYPPTKIMWCPDKNLKHPSLLATSCDSLRIWNASDSSRLELKCTLSNSSRSEFSAPLTSFDWNEADPTLLGTASIDTTCSIWNIETQQLKTQLIAHDKEVFDIAFAKSTDIFASAGGDSSIRMFDLRCLDHSTIIYESPDVKPCVRVGWNKVDSNYLATFTMDSSSLTILDIRVPSIPVMELRSHSAPINGFAWAPHSHCHICTAGDDKQALVWDLSSSRKVVDAPILAYSAEGEINQIIWSPSQTEWVAISFDDKIQALHV